MCDKEKCPKCGSSMLLRAVETRLRADPQQVYVRYECECGHVFSVREHHPQPDETRPAGAKGRNSPRNSADSPEDYLWFWQIELPTLSETEL